MRVLNNYRISMQVTPSILRVLEDQRKLSVIYFLLMLSVGFFTFFSAISFTDGNYELAVVDFSASILSVITFFWCYWKKTWEVISYFIISCLGVIFFYFIYSGGGGGELSMWLMVYPLLTIFLLGQVVGSIYSLVMLMFVIFSMHVLVDYGAFRYPLEFHYRFVGIYIVVFVFSFVYEISRKKTNYFLVKYMRRLMSTLNVLEKRRKQHRTIMDYVDQGLFLLDEKLVVQKNYSAYLRNILNINHNISGYSFSELLKNRTFDAVILEAEKYLEALLKEEPHKKINKKKRKFKNKKKTHCAKFFYKILTM